MTNNYSKDPKQAMAQFVASLPDDKKRAIRSSHLATLRSYAKRVLLEKDFLSPDEESDKELRLREFSAIGISFEMTDKEVAELLYKGLFESHEDCHCPRCGASEGTFL